MKLLAALLTLTLSACSSLSNPQGAAQPVQTLDYKNKIYKATCNGAVEDWPNCFDRAKQTCPNGYAQKERNQSPVGGKRELVFQCNK
ncbi:hypothetical protein [Candidatus Methylopumilus turicensis]|uniref:Putative lipoprotein n=1 Tax=Candidatus Methylopumilus turicensis TaxID=1581680 RepID=A0A0B7J1R7_9PROT|nr:hypothetical protein [Candidatus Methylopumilus turicensis]CEN56648.1 putative lipoprotein [Candidatus Methylopumilus turicensis]